MVTVLKDHGLMLEKGVTELKVLVTVRTTDTSAAR
jgi:hypothetical protein